MDDNVSETQLDEMIKDLETEQTNEIETRYIVTKLVIPVPTAIVQTGYNTCQQSFEYSAPLFEILGCYRTKAKAERVRNDAQIAANSDKSNSLVTIDISKAEYEI